LKKRENKETNIKCKNMKKRENTKNHRSKKKEKRKLRMA